MPNVLLDSSEQVQVFILNLDVPGEERLREVICNRLSLFCTPIGGGVKASKRPGGS